MEPKIKEIIRQVGDIGEKVSRLPEQENPPSIDLDIILGDIRVLYEAVKDLQSARLIPSREKFPDPPAVSPGEKQAPGGIREKGPVAQTGAGSMHEESPADAVGQAATANATAEKTEPAGKPDRSAPGGKPSEPSILADKYKGDKKFINESLAGNRGNQNISSKIQSKPIRNIGSALGINDRFKLINELFNGDKESFQNTINILDGSSNFNEAFNYINASFDWDMEEDSVQMLLELVRRKFIVNQNE